MLEGGGWAEGQNESQKFQSLFVGEMMGELGYAVVNVGPSDLLYGVETLKETAREAGFKLVSSNILKRSTRKPLFDPYLVVKLGGFRVGFLGVVSESSRLVSATEKPDDFAMADVETSAHAHSLATLEGKSMEGSADCLRCHVTGHDDPAGYLVNKTDFGKVSCEQCHGHGTMHGEPGFIAKPKAESCTVCHDKKNSPDFNFAKYWNAIAH